MRTKNKSLTRIILTAAILFSSITACKKDYWDINTDPNHPANVTVNLLLSSAEGAIAHTLGNDMQIYSGIWAQYWTQSTDANQYKPFDQYTPASNDFDYIWAILYSDALEDLKTVQQKAEVTGQTQFIAVSKILQAYTFQLLTDNFGSVPFSEALKADEGVLEPHYDAQSTVYDGVFRLLDEGIALIDVNATAATPGAPGTSDILLGGNMLTWKKFANTLKLRAYLRLSEVDPGKAASGIATLNGAEFLGAFDEVKVDYSSAGGNTNPLYSAEVALGFTQNLVASATTIDFYNINNDPRVDIFYIPASTGTQIGIPQGGFDSSPPGSPVSEPSAVTGASSNDEASALAPSKLMSGYESYFLQAEAVARGWLAGDATALYESGIRENFAAYGLADTDATTYIAEPTVAYPSGGTIDDKIKAIITQKWAAMCGNQNNEAWTEWRRTGYPDFFTVSEGSIIGGNNMPQKFLYPQSEIIANGNTPQQELPGSIIEKVWWDTH